MMNGAERDERMARGKVERGAGRKKVSQARMLYSLKWEHACRWGMAHYFQRLVGYLSSIGHSRVLLRRGVAAEVPNET